MGCCEPKKSIHTVIRGKNTHANKPTKSPIIWVQPKQQRLLLNQSRAGKWKWWANLKVVSENEYWLSPMVISCSWEIKQSKIQIPQRKTIDWLSCCRTEPSYNAIDAWCETAAKQNKSMQEEWLVWCPRFRCDGPAPAMDLTTEASIQYLWEKLMVTHAKQSKMHLVL